MRLYLATVLLTLATPASLAAQRLDATLVLADGVAPAAGTIVSALDATGRELSQTVTLEDGRFTLYADSLRPTRIRFLRAGFRAFELPAPEFAAAGVAVAPTRLTFAAEPIAAPKSFPRNASSCRGDEGSRQVVTMLLDEARKAMLAAQFRIGRPDIVARFATFNHRTAKQSDDTLYSMFRRGTGATPSLFDPVGTDQLERSGFFATIAGERVFFAPDLSVQLSSWFTDTHCFTLRQVTEEELVLAFEPSRERKGLVDVSGEYRYDRASLELRAIAFTYVGLPAEERKSGAGGALVFARTQAGNWLVSQWYQRFPLLGYRQGAGATTLIQSSMTLIDIIGHRSVGGRVTAVLHDRRPVYQRDALQRPLATSPFGQLCPERIVTANTAVGRGQLVATDSLGVEGVVVRATWSVPVVVDRTVMASREQVRETASDAEGRWTLCDIPVNRDVVIRWEIRGKEQLRPLTVTVPNSVVEVSGTPAP